MGASGVERPTVVVWRNRMLPLSNTFVRDQAAAMRRWIPRYAGMQREVGGLAVPSPLILTGATAVGRWERRRFLAQRRSRRLARLLRSPGVCLVHAHFGVDALSVVGEAQRAGVPLVVSFHGYDVTRRPLDPRHGDAYRQDLLDLFARADALLVPSDFLAGRLVALGAPVEKLHRHHIGIPVPPRRVPPLARRIVFVGRLEEVKGVEDLLQAVAALPARLRATPVHVLGNGPLGPHLQERARALGVDAVFPGGRTPTQVSAVLAGGGVFCGPSRRSVAGDEEAFGLVFLEAAAHGLPVVAYRSGGVPEAVLHGSTGLLAPEGDVAALSGHLERLLEDGDLARQLGERGRARVERSFDVVHRTGELERLFDALVDPRRPGLSVTAGAPSVTGAGTAASTATWRPAGARPESVPHRAPSPPVRGQ